MFLFTPAPLAWPHHHPHLRLARDGGAGKERWEKGSPIGEEVLVKNWTSPRWAPSSGPEGTWPSCTIVEALLLLGEEAIGALKAKEGAEKW